MDFNSFKASLEANEPPAGLSLALQALWHDGRGDWTAAHDCLQDDESREGAWVHAYLHRKEGDLPNAYYWYQRARQPVERGPLEQEWSEIARKLLEAN
jgi:hypothetical protein